MNVIIDTRVSLRMRKYLLANRLGKLHNDQWREVVMEPLTVVLILLVPALILLRSFLLTLFVGGLWMVGVGALLVGGVALFFRSRRYRRMAVHYGVFRSPPKLQPPFKFWKPIVFTMADGRLVAFKNSLAPDRKFQPDQEYLVYYFKSKNSATILSYCPTDHFEYPTWRPENHYKTS